MSFLDIVSKFNQQADSHSKSQTLNPFSEQFEQSRSPSPRFSREEYGKPVAGSKTDLRGRKAKSHICREILELCTVIHDVGTYKAKKREPDPDDSDHEDDGTIIVSFGELFQIYTKISDKVVGLLIAAKRRGFVYFDREILFQRRDDDVLIALMKPISEINKIIKDDISQASGATTPTPVEPTPEKKKSSSSSKTKRVKSSPAKNPNDAPTTEAAPGDQTNGGGASVNGEGVETGGKGPDDDDDGRKTSICSSDGVVNGEEAIAKTVDSVVEEGGDQIASGNAEEVNGEEVVSEIEINVIEDETVCNGDVGAETANDETVEVSECKEDETVAANVAETTGPSESDGATDGRVETHESAEAVVAGQVEPVETEEESEERRIDAIAAEGTSDRVETPNESDAKEVSDSGGGGGGGGDVVVNINKGHDDVASLSPIEN